MKFRSLALPGFWHRYTALPAHIQERAKKQYAIFTSNPRHPSLQLKSIDGLWSARVTDGYRALAFRDGNTFTWFWIGTHDEYERLLTGG